ncbi:MAG: aminopeptidase N [Thermodesulfobacteriota bacterium]|nr:aminopeptidase N [Thermodesulfobacteriota bacterium]
MSKNKPSTIYLKDYRKPDFLIDEIDLHFNLTDQTTTVTAKMNCRRNGEEVEPLRLHGEELDLKSVSINGRLLPEKEYEVSHVSLIIQDVPDDFILEIKTGIRPQDNTSLEGLYQSSGIYCTQCEAQGFRKIMFFLDRPDVMSRFTTTIEADRSFPVLISNGNLVDHGELTENRHYATWHDPFPKPCYLFALVAGDLVRIEDRFTTRSGRDVDLHIYVQKHNSDACDHAMGSLKKAMAWDERVFGLEYDLDLYMIVAVDDFNMGAMENKGLNIFNSKYVLARPQTATDTDYELIEAVIGHEYFHNWTGNRVTCRDWFQLSLKEGLTVFRDQEFSADMGSRPVKRMTDVSMLRNAQFPEDSGPMAHPVRPDSYIEINNFYTVTVYEKGAELIRMIHTLLGRSAFRRGMDLYFKRHDGQAVTTEDFVRAMEDASGVNLDQFRLWYSQAGTPVLTVQGQYDVQKKTYCLTVSQACPPTPNQPNKKPFHIPLSMGLLAPDGSDIPLRMTGEGKQGETSRVLNIYKTEEHFLFEDIDQEPTPSLLRHFSAPVKLQFDYGDDDLRFLLTHDSDAFNRWEAGQRYLCRILLRLVDDLQAGRELVLSQDVIETFQQLIDLSGKIKPTFLTQLLTLPAEKYLGEQMEVIDVEGIHRARDFTRQTLARSLYHDFLSVFHDNVNLAPYFYSAERAGQRSLKNLCLSYLMTLNEEAVLDLCLRQYDEAENMTDVLQAFQTIVHNRDCPEKKAVLVDFHNQWQTDNLVMDKWFAIQATAPLPQTLSEVQYLLGHPEFSMKNPNRVRALISSFCTLNITCFHHQSGEGYVFLADRVLELDPFNPMIAARLLAPLSRWQRFDPARQSLMKEQLERILAVKNLSKDVYEIAAKSLGKR